jgi:hypothetical protein
LDERKRIIFVVVLFGLLGIPFGSIHLMNGVATGESRIACTAGAGTLLLEFGTLSRLTGDDKLVNILCKFADDMIFSIDIIKLLTEQ